MTLYFGRVDDRQYVVTDKLGQIMGNLVRDSKGEWGFLTDRTKMVFLTIEELVELQNKIKDLKHEAKVSSRD